MKTPFISSLRQAYLTVVLLLASLFVNLVFAQGSADDYNSYFIDTGLVTLTKVAPREASLGETYTYSLIVRASAAVAKVKVNDYTPKGASFSKSEPSASVSGNKLTWEFEKMAPGEEVNITVWLTADKVGDLTGCATITALPVCCVATFVGKAELAITKTGPERALLNDNVTYSITVTNVGTTVAKNVSLVDQVPDGLHHDSGQTNLRYPIGDLAPNESREVPITFNAARPGRVCNEAVANADNTDRVSAEACTLIVEQKLEIVKTGPKEQYLGKVAKYKIKVSNPGDVTLTDVNLTDIAPSETRIIKAKNGNVSGNRASWIVPQIAAGETLDFDIALTSEIPGNHCNDAAVRVAEGLSGESTACTVWKGYPALLLEVIDTVDPLQVDIGEMTTYQIRVTNQGTAVDNNIGIVMRFPAEISAVSASGATSASVEAKTVKFAAYPQLAPKEVIEFIIEAKAEQIGDARLVVQLTSESLKSPVNEEESTHVY